MSWISQHEDPPLNLCKYSFTHSVVDNWNKLPMSAVNTPTINSLNSEVDVYLATHSSTSLVIGVGPAALNPVGFSHSRHKSMDLFYQEMIPLHWCFWWVGKLGIRPNKTKKIMFSFHACFLFWGPLRLCFFFLIMKKHENHNAARLLRIQSMTDSMTEKSKRTYID